MPIGKYTTIRVDFLKKYFRRKEEENVFTTLNSQRQTKTK